MKKFQNGFTLIELLVYVAILALTISVVVAAVAGIGRSYGRLRTNQALSRSATIAFERLVRDIHGAGDIDTTQSVLGIAPGKLVLLAQGVSSTITEFSIEGGTLVVKENGSTIGPLLTEGVAITSLLFNRIIADRSEAVKIDMTLEKSYGTGTTTATFHTTAVIRGSYAP